MRISDWRSDVCSSDLLVSEANVGLAKALGNFDPDLGFRFSTYSMWWIRAALKDYVIYNTSLVKIGTTHDQKRLFFRLRAIKAKLGSYKIGRASCRERVCQYV